MNKTLIQVVIGLVAAVVVLMLAGCDEEWGIAPTVKAYRQEEVTFAVGDSTVIDAETSNGGISVEAISGRLDLETSNGAITVYRVTGDVRADTSNGRIDVEGIVGSVRADTSNGSISLEKIDGKVNADTSNGSIRYEGRPVGQGNTLEMANGSITVRIPPEASVAFEISAEDKHIRSSLPITGDTEGAYWNAVLNSPAETAMSLRTSNGTIRIEPLP